MKILSISVWLSIIIYLLSVTEVVAQDQPKTSPTPSQKEVLEMRIDSLVNRVMEKVMETKNDTFRAELELALREVLAEMDEIEIDLEEEINEAIEDAIEDEMESDLETDIEDEIESMVEEALEGLDISIKKKDKPLKNVKTRWIMFDLGFATYINDGTLPEISGVNPMEPDILNSVSWNLHIMKQRINIIDHHINLIYGVGLSYNYYGFSENVTLDANAPEVSFDLDDENSSSYKKNHLRAAYLHLPLMLNFESNPLKKSKSFHFNAGVYGNVLLGAKTVQKTNETKIKVKDKFHLNNFQYGLLANIGYGPVTFYGTYGLNELFKSSKDAGYTVTPITFGIQILPF
ncbi:porin family protein [Membranihabitans marinus]|uniref:porin family protein n=1 Tax=Membranihabitans marinus TaxID=1227546 RepID=UPI001F46B3B1|nr:porin family protein [Membranihabitans marinus]